MTFGSTFPFPMIRDSETSIVSLREGSSLALISTPAQSLVTVHGYREEFVRSVITIKSG